MECNDQFTKHVLYSETEGDTISQCMQMLYSKSNLDIMSAKINQLLTGVNENNRPIIVPHSTICSVISAVYNNFRPETGDIFSRYNIPKSRGSDYIQRIIDETINIITTDVKNNLIMEQNNRKLTVWTTVLGDFNEHGLQSHPKIKIREKRPQPMCFNMNY